VRLCSPLLPRPFCLCAHKENNRTDTPSGAVEKKICDLLCGGVVLIRADGACCFHLLGAVEQLCANPHALENGQTSCTYPELDVTREHLLANFTTWRDKERAWCGSETDLEEKVMGLFGMSSNGYLQHAAGLEKGKDVWGTVLDLGLYTMFLDVRIVVIDVGQIRGDSSDEELLQSCSETGFPGECEKHRVVCAVCLGDHFDIGVVYGPKARAVFDVGDDWTRACVLILKHLRARILSPKPKASWALGPEQIRKLIATPLLNVLRASAATTTSTDCPTSFSSPVAFTPSTGFSSTTSAHAAPVDTPRVATLPSLAVTTPIASIGTTVTFTSATSLAGGVGGRVGRTGHPPVSLCVTENKLIRRERWDLERVQFLLDKLHMVSPPHYDVRILQFVKDHADKDGFLTVHYKYAQGSSCGRLFGSGLSFQSCTVATRSFCSARFYVEDDLVNAFATIMSQVFKSRFAIALSRRLCHQTRGSFQGILYRYFDQVRFEETLSRELTWR